MNLIGKITNLFTGGLVDTVADVADRFIETDDEKRQFKLQVEQLITNRITEAENTARSIIESRAKVMTAELQQGDNYTKRARPTLIYFGMLMIFLNYLVIPLIQTLKGVAVEPFILPVEFWVAWGGAVSVYTIGRSFEKAGASNRLSRAATGNQASDFIGD